jgi:hypothetical protein
VSDKTDISWTDATCSSCSETKPLESFALDKTHANGRTSVCRDCRNAKQRAKYVRKPACSRRGVLLAQTRNGDKKQARRRINHLVETGQLPRPEDLGCMDCGDAQGFNAARHEYDHARGYDGANQLYVEPVCSVCHHHREEARRG